MISAPRLSRLVQRSCCKLLVFDRLSIRMTSNNSSNNSKWLLNQTLDESDPHLFSLIQNEKRRQTRGIEMIASENFTSKAVLQALSTCLHNKYSEGYPGQRYVVYDEFTFM